VLAVLGPTATGKTALGIELARRLDGEIVSADSRQAYRGLAAGTAAPGPAERAAAPHHGVGFLPPGSRYGAGRFSRLARRWIVEIEGRGRVPILVGGTGLFRPLTWWQEHGLPEAEPRSALAVVLTLPGEEHRRRIRERAEHALDGGWADEVRRLRATGHGRESPAFSSIGYAAVDEWVAGEASREEALTRIVRDTWAYARRQRTWFRHQVPESALRLDARAPVAELADRVCAAWENWNRNGGRETGDG
jgi:tRNA A37 N6-isopentenylltransferase MiaA